MRVWLTRGILIGFVLTSVANVMMAAAQGDPEAAKLKNPVASGPESLASGKATFTRFCASCHGINAEGGLGNDITPPAPDLTDREWSHGSTDGEIFGVIKNGVPPDLNMEPWGDRLKEAEIWNIVNYLRSLAKEKK